MAADTTGYRTRLGAARPPDPGCLPADPAPGAALRLYCFPHAGGAASSFHAWRRPLAPGVSVLPVQLPGREGRAAVPRVTELARLVEEIDARLGPAPREPFAFYGHSMGALLAFGVCRYRRALGRSLPVALFAGGFGPPHRAPDLSGVIGLDDVRLGEWMLGLGGMSPVVLEHPRWLAAAAGLLRDDLTACAGYRYEEQAPLPCPIHVFRGTDDPLSRGDEEEWALHTSALCTVHDVPGGGHLFAYDPGFADEPRSPFRSLLRAAAAGRPGGVAGAQRV
jgi:surfactin synthase thioesterase subunit